MVVGVSVSYHHLRMTFLILGLLAQNASKPNLPSLLTRIMSSTHAAPTSFRTSSLCPHFWPGVLQGFPDMRLHELWLQVAYRGTAFNDALSGNEKVVRAFIP